MRLATPLYNMEAGAKSTVELRSNDEREHRGTEVDAPHRSWPPSSFLRNSKAYIAPSQLSWIYWCKVWHQTPLLARVIGGKPFDLGSGRHIERA